MPLVEFLERSQNSIEVAEVEMGTDLETGGYLFRTNSSMVRGLTDNRLSRFYFFIKAGAKLALVSIGKTGCLPSQQLCETSQ